MSYGSRQKWQRDCTIAQGYDPNKIKFEEMISNVPNSWFVFVKR